VGIPPLKPRVQRARVASGLLFSWGSKLIREGSAGPETLGPAAYQAATQGFVEAAIPAP
jgi:hypothetical protein